MPDKTRIYERDVQMMSKSQRHTRSGADLRAPCAIVHKQACCQMCVLYGLYVVLGVYYGLPNHLHFVCVFCVKQRT